jgi:hypothetical protein
MLALFHQPIELPCCSTSGRCKELATAQAKLSIPGAVVGGQVVVGDASGEYQLSRPPVAGLGLAKRRKRSGLPV